MRLKLTRFWSDNTATTGFLDGPDGPICLTLELPWRDNLARRSCIPLGSYQLIPYSSRSFGSTFLFRDVPGRAGILFHAGNTPADTKGCILLVRSVIYPPEGVRGLFSRPSVNKFMKALTGVSKATIDIVSQPL